MIISTINYGLVFELSLINVGLMINWCNNWQTVKSFDYTAEKQALNDDELNIHALPNKN